ncbi:ADP-ribosyltransferase, partial [Bacillus cereus]
LFFFMFSNEKHIFGMPFFLTKLSSYKISFIDSAINKATLQEDITVYRNTGEQELNAAKDFLQHTLGLDLNSLDGIKDFDKYINKAISLVNNSINKTNTALAYTSTSLQKNGVFSGSAIRMEIKVPKGG